MNPKIAELVRLTEEMPDPENYFKGLRRPGEAPPDNLVLFTRNRTERALSRGGSDDLHERWVLLVALAGAGELRLDRQPLRLKPGMALLMPPLHLHGYTKLAAQIHWLFVTFEWPGHSASSGDWQGIRRLDVKAIGQLQEVVRHYLHAKGDGTIAAAYLLTLLRQLYPPSAPIAAPTSSLLTAVQAAAQAAPGETLSSLAKRMGISESHLRTKFRNEAGLSLGRYLREARLRKAALWLREEGLSVKAAAERSGYPDVFTFSKAFRRVLGIPPSTLKNDIDYPH